MSNEIQDPPEFCPMPEPETAVVKRDADPPAVIEPETVPVNPSEARNSSVGRLLDTSYQGASLLKVTKEEAEALAADFPDEAFSLGAGGDPNLIYIEHAYLRQRLNRVLGIGAAVPIRRREWAEEFTYKDKYGKVCEATRIYADMCLIVRGCLVGESVGEGVYYKSNAKSNYGDALESAMSNAFRRCCKQFGVGLQAWMRGWGEGWKARRATGASRPPYHSTPAVKTPEKPVSGSAKASPAPAETPEQRRARWIMACTVAGGGKPDYAHDIAVELGILLPNEPLNEWPVERVPTTKRTADELLAEIRKRAGVTAAPTPEPVSKNETRAPIEVPRDPPEPWRSFPVPFGKDAGMKLEDLPKAKLFGWWCNFKVETEYNGKPKRQEQIERDQAFRDALDQASAHYQFSNPDAEPADDPGDDVPTP